MGQWEGGGFLVVGWWGERLRLWGTGLVETIVVGVDRGGAGVVGFGLGGSFLGIVHCGGRGSVFVGLLVVGVGGIGTV